MLEDDKKEKKIAIVGLGADGPYLADSLLERARQGGVARGELFCYYGGRSGKTLLREAILSSMPVVTFDSAGLLAERSRSLTTEGTFDRRMTISKIERRTGKTRKSWSKRAGPVVYEQPKDKGFRPEGSKNRSARKKKSKSR